MQGNFFLGYLAAGYGLKIPHSQDILFVETWVYGWGLLLEKSISAYWIENFEEALKLSLEILHQEDLPENVRQCVERNMQFSIDKLSNYISNNNIPVRE